MTGRLVALDKCPGVRPIGVGETWRRLIAKTTLLLAGSEAKELCGIQQLCAGLEAGIEGGIHAIDELWKKHEEEEEWGFLLVDASNAFNELNRTAMLCIRVLYTLQDHVVPHNNTKRGIPRHSSH